MTDIEEKNKSKWLHPPDSEMIISFIKELNVTFYRFEKFYGMPKGTIKLIKHGSRDLPVKFWHIIYDKVQPKFGIGFMSDYGVSVPKKRNKTSEYTVTKTVARPTGIPKIKGRLKDLFD